jgi:A/G-specific adenine glycosylase
MPVDAATALLAWYDVHARTLPWRAPPGTPAPDPYRVWLSEIMLQQTSVAAVRGYFERFTAAWPTIADLAAADEAAVMTAWAGLGYYARARNLIACARAVVAAGGFPQEEAGLRALPGIGDYTAAAVTAIAFGRRAVVVDANVERVVARVFAMAEPLPAARSRIRALADTITPDERAGDFAQAMMDLGSTICTFRKPACAICPLREQCAAVRTGAPEAFPVKLPKKPRPVRYGTAYWAVRDDTVLLQRRAGSGLLGGMRALPTGPWRDEDPGLEDAPFAANWRPIGTVVHVFTHFALELRVVGAVVPARVTDGEWWPISELAQAGLPTLFAKAASLAQAEENMGERDDERTASGA